MRSWKTYWVSRSRPPGSDRGLVDSRLTFGVRSEPFLAPPRLNVQTPPKGHRLGNSRNKPMLQAPDKLDNRVRLQPGRDHSGRSFAAKRFFRT